MSDVCSSSDILENTVLWPEKLGNWGEEGRATERLEELAPCRQSRPQQWPLRHCPPHPRLQGPAAYTHRSLGDFWNLVGFLPGMLIALYICKSLYISNPAARLLIIAIFFLPPVRGIAGIRIYEGEIRR